MHHNPLRRYAELQDELLTRKAAGSLRAFVEQAWPVLEPTTPFLPNWHIDLVCEHLEAITAGQTTRLLINLPPRYMKSLLVSVFWPVWEWISSPSRRWICVSYSDALSLKLSLDRRTLVQSEWYQARWGHTVQLSSDQNVKGEFRNTRQGVMCATSVGGSATGKGGDRIIVDDLHNPQQADSDAQREAALRFFRETLSTRLDTPKTGAIVVVMQRLHEADLSARCLELGYRHLCLPVKADVATDIVFPVSGRVVTRAPGHLLWPAREGPTELALQRRQLGSTAFDTQYQQRPAPAGGRLFKRAWFKFYDERPRVSTWLASWDMSFKGGPSNDYVVGLQAAREGADVYLVDRVKGQWDFTETCRQVVRLHDRYPETQTILIEEAANGFKIIAASGIRVGSERVRVEVEPSQMEVDGVAEPLAVAIPAGLRLIHWILALMPSERAFVTLVRTALITPSQWRLIMRATFLIGSNRLRIAHPYQRLHIRSAQPRDR